MFDLHMKKDQLTIVQGAIEAINLKPTTLEAVKNQIKTTLVEQGLMLTCLKFLHYDFFNSFSKNSNRNETLAIFLVPFIKRLNWLPLASGFI